MPFMLAVALLCTSLAAAAPADIVLVPRQVSPHGWFFEGEAGMASVANKGFMSNAGFVVTSDGVVVFDALGTPALGEAMVKAIRTVTRQPIRRVIVSHYHADHFYGLQALKAAGAEVWAHRGAHAYIDSPACRRAHGAAAQRPFSLGGRQDRRRRPTSTSTATPRSAWAGSRSA